METKKMSFANVQGKLSRAEMKNVMAGDDDTSLGNECTNLSEDDCRQKPPCTLSSGSSGKCGWTTAWNRCTCAGS